jgi:hypothetical protein
MLNNIVGKYNIVKDYDWTSIPRGADLRNKAPKVVVRSYKLKSNSILNRLKNYIQVVSSSSSKDFYNKMYGDATVQEDDFYFPYFEDGLRNIKNTFGDTFQDGFGGGGGLGGGIENLFKDNLATIAQGVTMFTSDESRADFKSNIAQGNVKDAFKSLAGGFGKGGAAGSYIETPKFYEYGSASEDALNVNFKLANTINSDFMKNYELVKKLVEINKPKRNDAISLDPPRIYRVKLYGYRYMPWAYVSNLSINMEGSRRMIGDVIIPEAYSISIGFQPLTIEVSNFLDEA